VFRHDVAGFGTSLAENFLHSVAGAVNPGMAWLNVSVAGSGR
jgi:hypothetical protein